MTTEIGGKGEGGRNKVNIGGGWGGRHWTWGEGPTVKKEGAMIARKRKRSEKESGKSASRLHNRIRTLTRVKNICSGLGPSRGHYLDVTCEASKK